MKSRLSLFVLAVLLAASQARAADTPQPSLFSAENNVAFAAQAICAPYVFDGVEEAKLPLRRPLVAQDGYTSPTIQRLGVKAVRVGMAGFVHVAVATDASGRRCELSASHADPQALRKAVLAALAERPEHLAPTKSHYLPGRWESEDMLCTAADSAHPGGYVLMSVAPAAEKDRIAILFTMAEAQPRGEQCDHEGVKMNYRTLIP